MNSISCRAVIVVGFVCTLGGASSWGGGPQSNKVSNAAGNTSGANTTGKRMTPGRTNGYALYWNTTGANTTTGTNTLPNSILLQHRFQWHHASEHHHLLSKHGQRLPNAPGQLAHARRDKFLKAK
jgi:hypothetical protein